MSNFMEAASAVLASAQRQVEVSAQNISNMGTPGYRRRISFEQAMANAAGAVGGGLPANGTLTDFTAGKPIDTNGPFDLAITGNGFFTVRSGDQLLYTRNGQFKRDQDNRIVTQTGLPVQLQGGGDLTLQGDQFKVLADGTVTDNDEPVGRLALASFTDPRAAIETDGGLFTARPDMMADAKDATVSQGALEASNTSLGEEMMAIMQSLRSAETAQRLVGVYDDLLGRAISTFGQQS